MTSSRTITSRRRALGLLAGLAPGLPARSRAADSGREIVWVVPNGPGSTADVAARLIAPGLAARLGQRVVVENRTGAGGLVAAEAVARAAPDGRTMLFGSSSIFAIAPLLTPGSRFDPLRDVAPVGGIGSSWTVLFTAAAGPHADLPALLRAARAAPGRLSCAVPVGSAQHLAALLFAQAAGIEINLVTGSASASGLQDVLAGRVDFGVEFIPLVLPLVAEGHLRMLAANAPTRLEQVPEVPTLDEFGIAGAEAATWSALYVPARTPPETIARLAEALRGALAEPRVRETILRLGGTPMAALGGPALTAMLQEDQRRFRALFAAAGLLR